MGLSARIKIGIRRFLLLFYILLTILRTVYAKQVDEEYWKVVTRRAEKIVETLELNDTEKEERVRDIIAMQYVNLSGIHDTRDEEIKGVEERKDLDQATAQKRVGKIRNRADKKIKKLHRRYLELLSAELTPEQINRVKDGMTYGILDHTYNAYLSLLPSLTPEQREKIMEWLVEAREIAMDAGSSEEKLACFGKYKGKINNYISAEGYDLKKAEKQRR